MSIETVEGGDVHAPAISVVEVIGTSSVLFEIVGDPGPPGPAGEAANPSFQHSQSTPGAVWTITHNLGYDPAGFTVVDTDGYVIDDFGVQYLTSGTSLRLTFDISLAGVAYLS